MTAHHNKGFTVIEVIIYIALFSLLIGTAFTAAYQLIDGSGKLSTKNTTQEEGNFVMRKLDWALTGVATITTPASGNSSTLVVTKYDGDVITIQKNGTALEIKESTNGNIFIPLTTSNVVVSSLDFAYQSLGGITTTVIIDGTTFTSTKYFRK